MEVQPHVQHKRILCERKRGDMKLNIVTNNALTIIHNVFKGMKVWIVHVSTYTSKEMYGQVKVRYSNASEMIV